MIIVSDPAVTAAGITVAGMLGVALATALGQWVVTRTIIRSEYDRLRAQLRSEFEIRQFEQWQERFQETVWELLKETDPEVIPSPNRGRVVPLIQRAQLMLNLDVPAHRAVNGLINELGLAVNGWKGPQDRSQILRLHGAMLEAARDALYLPGRKHSGE